MATAQVVTKKKLPREHKNKLQNELSISTNEVSPPPPPPTIGEIKETAEAFASSSLVPQALRGKPEDLFVTLMYGQSLGLAPAQAMNSVNIVHGKPSLSAEAMTAVCRNCPEFEDLIETVEDRGTENPSAVCIAKRKGCSPVKRSFSVADARRAGLWGCGAWKKYPEQMLRIRARTAALRDLFADVLAGMPPTEQSQTPSHTSSEEVDK